MAVRVITLFLTVFFILLTTTHAQSPVKERIRHAVQIRDTLHLSLAPKLHSNSTPTSFIDGRELPVQWEPNGTTRTHAVLVVVDISKSMTLRNMNFVKHLLLKVSHALDSSAMLGMATLGDDVEIHVFPTINRTPIRSWTDSLEAVASNTGLREGLIRIITWFRNQISLPPERSIVFFTDGVEDSQYGMTREEMKEILVLSGIPVHVIPVRKPESDAGMEIALVTRSSGGNILPASTSAIDSSVSELVHSLIDHTSMRIPLPSEICDGGSHTLEVVFEHHEDYRRVRRAITIGALGDEDSMTNWLFAALVTIATIAALLLIFRKNRNRVQWRQGHTALSNISDADTTVHLPVTDSKFLNHIYLYKLGRGEDNVISWKGSKNEAIAGRLDSCDLVLDDDDRISSRHCRFRFAGDGVFLNDLNSTNGTYVNGVRIENEYLLSDDDVILVGNSEYRLRIRR